MCCRSCFEKCVGFGQILTVGSLALVQIGHRIQAHAIYTHSSQKSKTAWSALRTSGLSKFKSGWCE